MSLWCNHFITLIKLNTCIALCRSRIITSLNIKSISWLHEKTLKFIPYCDCDLTTRRKIYARLSHNNRSSFIALALTVRSITVFPDLPSFLASVFQASVSLPDFFLETSSSFCNSSSRLDLWLARPASLQYITTRFSDFFGCSWLSSDYLLIFAWFLAVSGFLFFFFSQF